MSGKIINLRQARKRREKEAKAATADANRVKFGRTKAERDTTARSAARDAKHLDGHRITRTTDPDEPGGDTSE